MKRIVRLLIVVPITVYLTVFIMNRLSRPTTQLGVIDGQLAPCSDRPNCVSSQAEDDVHRVEPIQYDVQSDAAWVALQKAVATVPRVTVIADDGSDYMRCECRTAIMRFVDDVEFMHEPTLQTIHVRSASRVGHSDLGANRKRVEFVRRAFESAVHDDKAIGN